ncbi:MAG TPA: hypothetical protein VK638_45170 [Edaphobacter sp.]|nr:hypothetical protein [Edaphobacter sp.]
MRTRNQPHLCAYLSHSHTGQRPGWVGHTGELPGYNTAVYYHAASDITVAVQTNSDIASGDCAESPTLANDPRDSVCSSPATRIFAAITEALGHKFTPIPAR